MPWHVEKRQKSLRKVHFFVVFSSKGAQFYYFLCLLSHFLRVGSGLRHRKGNIFCPKLGFTSFRTALGLNFSGSFGLSDQRGLCNFWSINFCLHVPKKFVSGSLVQQFPLPERKGSYKGYAFDHFGQKTCTKFFIFARLRRI